jgi:hypothetical protein
MAVKSTELRSGVFVVLAVVALTILIFSVGNFRARLKSTSRYVTYVENAKFLKAHDPVTYGGYKVGEIKVLEVAPDRHGRRSRSTSSWTPRSRRTDHHRETGRHPRLSRVSWGPGGGPAGASHPWRASPRWPVERVRPSKAP